QDLLQALLQAWEKRNTGLIRDQAALPSRTITGALCNLFRIFIDPSGFNHQLDFAIREWARRSSTVNEAVRSTDQARLQIVTELFERHGYTPAEALMRARILYYMQIGYYALELHEPVETRLSNVPGYILGFTGQDPDPQDLEDFVDFVRSQAEGQMA
ncbi:MAG: TetR/AcrR family transcriptional regulator, partial [Pseudomonadota bacterium]